MANEITVNSNLAVTKGGATQSYGIANKLITQAGSRYIKTVQVIGTSEEALQKGELGTLGLAFFKNLDTVNFVTILMQTADTIGIKIKAGETAGPFRLTAAPFAKADTAPVAIEFLAVED